MDQKKQPGIVRRAAGSVGRAWAYSLGITSLFQTGKRLLGKGVNLAGFVQRKLNDSPENYRNETFEEAVDRLSLDEAHLVRQARSFNIRAMSWMAALLLATLWLAWLPQSNAPFQHVVLCAGIMFMTAAKSLTWRFRYCQIRDQALYGFGPWFWSFGRRW